MHAHYHTSSKLSRKADPRRALVRGLVDSLILYERITTTKAKAKLLVATFDRLVTRAKKGRLIDVRYVFAHTNSPIAAQKLLYELVDGMADRNSGYTRTTRVLDRRGDGAPMVTVEIILSEAFKNKQSTKTTTETVSKKPVASAKQARTAKSSATKTTVDETRSAAK